MAWHASTLCKLPLCSKEGHDDLGYFNELENALPSFAPFHVLPNVWHRYAAQDAKGCHQKKQGS